jgi:hypothetical protein
MAPGIIEALASLTPQNKRRAFAMLAIAAGASYGATSYVQQQRRRQRRLAEKRCGLWFGGIPQWSCS